MKRKMLSKVAITMLATTMVVAPLGGCRGIGNGQADSGVGNDTTDITADATVDDEAEDTTGVDLADIDADLLDFIQTNFAASELPENYNQPMYNLPGDYVFEFECCEEVGDYPQDAFVVVDNIDYVNGGGMDFNWNTYEDGKITVAPYGAIYLTENGSSNIHDGTWGSLNVLYLVQNVDLTTGEELEKPLITPFTVVHDLEAPIVHQGVDENNCYTLSWDAVPDAVEYRVYTHSLNYVYSVECVTTDTSVSVSEFETQKQMEEYEDLIAQEYIDAGYDSSIVGSDGVTNMNYGVKYSDEMEDGYFLVVAVGEDGKQSGASNCVDVRDIAMKLPHEIQDQILEVEIASIEDVPAYVNVEMVDGSVQQMLIDYKGATVYSYPDDENKIALKCKVLNTQFDSFFVVLSGMYYEDVLAQSEYVKGRQDELASTAGATQEPEMSVTHSPSEGMDEAIEEAREEMITTEEPSEEESEEPSEEESEEPSEEEPEEPSEEESEEPSEEESEEPSEEESEEPSEEESEEPSEEESEEPSEEEPEEPSDNTDDSLPRQLMNDIASEVQSRIETLGSDKVSEVMYASNDLQAWMAMCLMTQMEIVPVPVEVFQDAANLDYVSSLFVEAYRQNPTSGIVVNVGYSPEYQAMVVEYVEPAEERLAKAKEELDAAYTIKSEIISDDMSDYDKVLAINEYFRLNASYDFDSTETNITDYSTLSEQFIDSHTPYGIIVNNYGVCESYSEAFVLVARYAGLDAMCEVGTMYGGGHEWNRVKVDGSWCVLDVTNNDMETFINGLMNVTDDQVSGILVPDKASIRNHENYIANDETKEYYYVNGQSVTDLSQADDKIAELLATSDSAIVRIPADSTKEELENVLKDLVYEHEVNFKEAGAKFNLLCITK